MTEKQLYQLKWKPQKQNESNKSQLFTLELWNYAGDTLMAAGDDEILSLLQKHTVCGIMDDYPFWKKEDGHPFLLGGGGPPLLLERDATCLSS